MERRKVNIWLVSAAAVIIAAVFCAGLFIGRNSLKGDDLSFSVEYEHSKQTVYKAAEAEKISSKININTATAQELSSLDGIGEATAEKIIAYRDMHGDFKYEYEIMNVSGIGEAKYKAIKDYITVK